MQKLALSSVLMTVATLMSACNDIGFTAPVPTSTLFFVHADQQVNESCGTVTVSSINYPGIGVSLPPSPTADQPYHLGSRAEGFPRTAVTSDEYSVTPSRSIFLKRFGSYVYPGVLLDTGTYKMTATCATTDQSWPITVTANVPYGSFDGYVVLGISRTADGALTATMKIYAKGSTPDQLGLP